MKITSEQKNKILTWAEERDAILKEISILSEQKSSLLKQNKEASLSITEKEKRKNELNGELKQLKKIEVSQINSISKELSNLKIEKVETQTKISKEKELLKSVIDKKDSTIKIIESLLSFNEKLSDKNIELEKVVDKVKEVNKKSISDINKMFIGVKDGLASLITKEKKASESADVILNKLPMWVFELQRPISLKRITNIKKKK